MTIDPDPVIFTTPAAENGYGDSIIKITGHIIDTFTLAGGSLAKIETELGDICIYLNDGLINWADETYPEGGTCWENWHSMLSDDPVIVYVSYQGYSSVLDCASGILLYAE